MKNNWAGLTPALFPARFLNIHAESGMPLLSIYRKAFGRPAFSGPVKCLLRAGGNAGDLPWLFWTKCCEKLRLERSLVVPKKRFSAEQILTLLRQIEVLIAQVSLPWKSNRGQPVRASRGCAARALVRQIVEGRLRTRAISEIYWRMALEPIGFL